MSFAQRLGKVLEIPGEAMFALPTVQWTGEDTLVVQNHLGIADYTPAAVVIDTRCGQYRVQGEELYLELFSREMLVLRGNIGGITLCRQDA